MTFLSGQYKCVQQVISFLPRRPNAAGTRAVLWKRRKKAKPKHSVHSPSKHPEVNSRTDYASPPAGSQRTTRRTRGFSKQKLLSVQDGRGCLPSAQNTRNWGRPPPAPDRVGTQAGRQDTRCRSHTGPGRGQRQPALIDTRLVQTHSRDSCSSSCENRNQRSKAPL